MPPSHSQTARLQVDVQGPESVLVNSTAPVLSPTLCYDLVCVWQALTSQANIAITTLASHSVDDVVAILSRCSACCHVCIIVSFSQTVNCLALVLWLFRNAVYSNIRRCLCNSDSTNESSDFSGSEAYIDQRLTQPQNALKALEARIMQNINLLYNNQMRLLMH